MRRAGLLLALLLIGDLTGCGLNVEAIGAGPWPVYDEPKALEFTEVEKSTLTNFAKDHKELFAKIQGQEHAYRAIVQEHNKRAREQNRKKLEALGFKDKDLQDVLKSPKP